VGVTVAVGDGVGVGVPLTTVALAQSSTSIPNASCAAAQTSVVHVPGSAMVVVTESVVVAPTARPSLNSQPV
jgi:hypothetical protein